MTFAGNLLIGTKLSEFHTGYRAFSRKLLERLPLDANSDDFVFDNQILAEVAWLGLPIGEVSCPTSYAPESSSINFARSVRYGFGCLNTALQFRLARMGLSSTPDAISAIDVMRPLLRVDRRLFRCALRSAADSADDRPRVHAG